MLLSAPCCTYNLLECLKVKIYETTAKTLANVVEHLLDFAAYDIEKLQQLEDVGVKVAGSIFRFFHDEENLHILKKLELLGISLKNQKKQPTENGLLAGETFLFTGTLSKLKRSDAEEMVEKNGGKIVSGVSSKLNYLVVGEDAGSKLEKAKKITAIKIISEDDFIKLLPG
jgi:DNA ligase (NAD+)